jgi:hypothetical protein
LQAKKTKKTNDKVIVASLSQPSAITKNVEIVANVSSSQPATVSKFKPVKYGVIINVNHKFMVF